MSSIPHDGPRRIRPVQVLTNDPTQLPQNVEAEKAVLGSMLLDGSMADEVFTILKPEQFYTSQWRDVAEGIKAVFDRGDPIDVITVVDELQNTGKIGEEVGLLASDVTALPNQVPHAEHAATYARIVRDTAIRREVIKATGIIANTVHKEADAAGGLAYAQSLLKDIGDGMPEQVSQWQFQDFAALRVLPRPEWLINGIIKKGTTSVWYGGSGEFKSFICDSMAYALATEMRWLDRYDVAEGARVLYLAGEGVGGVRARFLALEAHHKRTPQPGRLTWFGGVPRLIDEANVLSLIEAIKAAGGFDCVVLDTFGRAAVGGDDNATDEMSIMVDRCEQIARECDTHVMIVHHKNRGGTERGNLVMRNNSETMWEVSRKEKEYVATLNCTKQKEADEPHFDVKLIEVQFGDHPDDHSLVCVPVDADHQPAPLDTLLANDKRILRELANRTDGMTKADIRKATGIPDTTLDRRIPHLIACDYVKQDGFGRGALYFLTPAGGQAIGVYVNSPHNPPFRPMGASQYPPTSPHTSIEVGGMGGSDGGIGSMGGEE